MNISFTCEDYIVRIFMEPPWKESYDQPRCILKSRDITLPTEVHIVKVTQVVKCLPAMWKTQVRSLGQEDPLEKEMATHSSTLA